MHFDKDGLSLDLTDDRATAELHTLNRQTEVSLNRFDPTLDSFSAELFFSLSFEIEDARLNVFLSPKLVDDLRALLDDADTSERPESELAAHFESEQADREISYRSEHRGEDRS